jgi:hypothetical protein
MTVSRNKTAAAFALFLLASATFIIPAHAGKTDMQTLNVAASKKTESISSADLTALESAGLYSSAEEGSLGKALWNGIRRSDLLYILENMPVASSEPAVQRLIFGALLSRTDASLIDNDIPPAPGNDLLTLRIEKLIQAGAYRQAQDLYSSSGVEEPYHERLARAGILAMLLNGEKSLACVETETSKDHFPESDFIKQILAFCDITLSDAPSEDSSEMIASMDLKNKDILTAKDGSIRYNPESFGALSLIEKAFLAAEKKIAFESVPVDTIPPEHLRILIEAANLDPGSHFQLIAAAQNWGLALPGEMKDAYKAALPPVGGDPSKLSVPDSAPDWEKIGLYYAIASSAEEESAQWDAIKKALDLKNSYGIAALAPFAGLLAETQPGDASIDQIETGLHVLVAAGKPLPAQWIERVKQIPLSTDKTPENQRLFALHLVADLSQKNGKNLSGKDGDEASLPYPQGSRREYLIKNIIENLDSTKNNSHNTNTIYEKDYDLTFKQDYVMPNGVVWNHLLEAGQNRETGKTVLLGASVLQAADLGKIYPGLLNDVRNGLSNVGLTDISSNLAMSAILGSVQKDN